MQYICFLFAISLIGTVLTGCSDMIEDVNARSAKVNAFSTPVPIAMASFDGAPEAVSARFSQSFVQAAAQRHIIVSETSQTQFLVRGYFSVATAEGSTSFDYVWDAFDRSSRTRLRRMTDRVTVKTTAADPWSLVSDQVITALAAQSANELVEVLRNGQLPAEALAPVEVKGSSALSYAPDQ